MPDKPGDVANQRGVTVPAEVAADLLSVAVIGLTELARRHGEALPAHLQRLVPILNALHKAAEHPQRPDHGTGDVPPATIEEGCVWVTAGEAGRAIGASPEYVRRLARQGRITARRHGHTWLIDPHSYRKGQADD